MQKVINRVSSTYLTHSNPTHLIIIQHGWLAPWIRATPLGKYIAKIASEKNSIDSDNRYLIHIIRSNSNDYLFGWIKTQDGIDNGALRTCSEIKNILNEYNTLSKISLIGSSLGGLYLRYSIKYLYDKHSKTFYNNIVPYNYISLGTPHLGVADWVKYKQYKLYILASYLSSYKLLPSTMKQLLCFDGDNDNNLLYKLANHNDYLEPLSLFKNRLIYANIINDNRVSCSSGLILPSFDLHNEEQLIKDLFIKHIDSCTKDKISIIAPLKLGDNDNDINIRKMLNDNNNNNNNKWHSNLRDSMEWNRFIVSMNSNYIDKQMAHGLLANPVPFYRSCHPLLNHLNNNFLW